MSKEKRLRQQKNVIQLILLIAGIVMLILAFLVYKKKNNVVLIGLGFGLIGAGIIFRFFKSNFGYKPTREEMEESTFGK